MRIHLLGIGGVAMGNLAIMLKQQGHQVSGSDHQKLYPPMSDKLKQHKIHALPFSKRNLRNTNTDLYIIGNAISRGNIELEAILNQNLPYMSMPQALREFFLQDKHVIVIAGTHGKTSTSFLLDHILNNAQMHNGFFAGGVRSDGMDGFRVGKGKYFVIEGDEYDSAFFDKNAKFFHYHPYHLILTALEYDHADIYPNAQSYALAFARLLRFVPQQGLIIACKTSRGLQKLLQDHATSLIKWYDTHQYRYGKLNLSFIEQSQNFALSGSHNQANALAASLMAAHIGVTPVQIQQALESFAGVQRRLQIYWQTPASVHSNANNIDVSQPQQQPSITFIEDFAHHPGAVAASIAAVRQAFPHSHLHVLFEPRSASSHRKLFQERYYRCFQKVDSAYLCEVYQPQKVAPAERLNVRQIVRQLQQQCQQKHTPNKRTTKTKIHTAYYASNPQAMLKTLQKNLTLLYQKKSVTQSTQAMAEKMPVSSHVILALSNGSFGGIYAELARFLQKMARL